MPASSKLRTAANKRKALKAYPLEGTIAGTARAIGMERKTVADWIKEDPEFAAAITSIDEATIERVEATLLDMALDKDIAAISLYLKARSQRYRPQPLSSPVANVQQQVIVRMESPQPLPTALPQWPASTQKQPLLEG